jgi:hypothetical protein
VAKLNKKSDSTKKMPVNFLTGISYPYLLPNLYLPKKARLPLNTMLT